MSELGNIRNKLEDTIEFLNEVNEVLESQDNNISDLMSINETLDLSPEALVDETIAAIDELKRWVPIIEKLRQARGIRSKDLSNYVIDGLDVVNKVTGMKAECYPQDVELWRLYDEINNEG